MKRLVYSPKVYAFVNTDSGIIDLTPYITDCSVGRVINQASTASVTFRNPDRKFTSGKDGPTFHPMDPIVIFMKRLHDRPVQIFTGYCDTTPYYQLKPGPATISASCTLKRLLHTYWDPGLPFVQRVLQQRGWAMYFDGEQGSLGNVLSGAAELDDGKDDDDDKPRGNHSKKKDDEDKDLTGVTDGSIGALLFDVLMYIGNWHSDSIYIEDIPKTVYEGAESLLGDINKANKVAQKEWTKLLKQIIGEDGSYGGGGGSIGGSGPLDGEAVVKVVGPILLSEGFTMEAAAGILGNAYGESNWSTSAMEGSLDNGGLWGFTSGEKSMDSLRAFASKKGGKWDDAEVQTRFMLTSVSADFKKEMNNCKTVYDATELFGRKWEIPLDLSQSLDKRVKAGNRAFKILSNMSDPTPPKTKGSIKK